MLYFHNAHRQQLLSMQQQCKQAKNIGDLHHLASDIDKFYYYVHNHHTIEDREYFPRIARRIDISHLEVHHEQLAQLLVEFNNFSRRLKQLKNPDEDINTVIIDATSIVDRVSKLVNDHERAEEQVIQPDNMKKYFKETEMKNFFNL